MLLCVGSAYAITNTVTGQTAPVTVTYTLPNNPGPAVAGTVTATLASTFIYVSNGTTVNGSSQAALPAWLTVTQSASNAAAGSAASFNFKANAIAGTMQPGSYTATVYLTTVTSGYTSPNNTTTITVTLSVKAAAGKFGCTASNNGNLSWSPGSNYPTMTVTCSSTGEEIAYTIAPGGSISSSMVITNPGQTATVTSGIAYSFSASSFLVSFSPTLFLSNPPGTPLSGTVTMTPSDGSAPIVVNVNINLTGGTLTIASLSPAELPVDTSADHTIVLTGTGFVPGVTTVTIANQAASPVTNTLDTFHAVVVSSTNMILTIDHATYLAAAHVSTGSLAGLPLKINAANSGTAATGGPLLLTVSTAPIIYGVTNAASFAEGGGNPALAPYEIISIFGANFDSGDGVTVNQSAASSPYVYSKSMNNSAGNAVFVRFYSGILLSGDSGGGLADAPIIFVSKNQINAIVPSALSTPAVNSNNLVVSVNAVKNDVVVPVDIVANAPGIFTPSGTGQGVAAVINADGTLNSASNPATHGTTVSIYATGLGTPNATGVADGTNALTAFAFPATCMAMDNSAYLGVLQGTIDPPSAAYGNTSLGSQATGYNASTYTTLDGAVFASAFTYAYLYPPCFVTTTGSNVVVTLKNTAAGTPANGTVTYAGFVPDAVAGLYQVNVTLPTTFTPALASTVPYSGVTLSLAVAGGSSSPAGVVVYIK